MDQQHRRIVNPSGVSPPLGRYSHLARVRAGELLFLAGQVAVDLEGNVVGEGDVAAQVGQVYENIGRVLKSAGASFGDVVQFTTYLTGRELVDPFLEARTKIVVGLYPDGDFPPSTLLIVSGLFSEQLLLEVTTVAALA